MEQDPLLLLRAGILDRGQVEQEAEDPGPLDVAQELQAETLALAGPLDEAGDVGHHELPVVTDPHHTEVRDRGW